MFNGKLMKFSISAINKRTQKIEIANLATKFDEDNIKNEFMCCDCSQDLKLAKGKIRSHYYSHICLDKCLSHTVDNKICESDIHKEAKIQFKIILESPIVVSIKRTCPYKSTCIMTTVIPQVDTNDEILLEHSFKFNGQRYADVAWINTNRMKYCFEIKHTSRTEEWKRPEPWYEFESIDLLNKIAMLDKNSTSIIFDDIRCVNCDECKKGILYDKFRIELKLKYNEKMRRIYKAEELRFLVEESKIKKQIAEKQAEKQAEFDTSTRKSLWDKHYMEEQANIKRVCFNIDTTIKQPTIKHIYSNQTAEEIENARIHWGKQRIIYNKCGENYALYVYETDKQILADRKKFNNR